MPRIATMLLVAGMAGLLGACSAAGPAKPVPASELPPPPGGANPRLLQGVTWQVTMLAGRPVEGATPTLVFADGSLAGNSGCGLLRGSYAVEAGQFRIRAAPADAGTCPEPVRAQEGRLLAFLATVTAFTFDFSGNLVLTAPDGSSLTAARG